PSYTPSLHDALPIYNSQAMLDRLQGRFGDHSSLVMKRCSFLGFEPEVPLDLVVSNYALHHLRNGDKLALVTRTFDQLRPGARFVVSDIMVPLTLRPGKSRALRTKVWAMLCNGPSGIWRIAKNA